MSDAGWKDGGAVYAFVLSITFLCSTPSLNMKRSFYSHSFILDSINKSFAL